MEFVKKDFEIKDIYCSYLNFYSKKFMEFNLLCLIMCNYISDGTDGHCDFDNLVQVLKKIGLPQLALKLEALEKKWNEENDDRIFINELDGKTGNSRYMETCKEDLTDVNGARRKVCLPYFINPSSMGLCVIINQETFSQRSKKTGLDNRYGTNIDRDMVKITFASFGYNVLIFQDLNYVMFITKLQQTIQNEVRREHSSFILCILSHGKRDEVYCTDGFSFKIEEIEKLMLGQTCPALLGKPKILIVQACQGEDTLQAMELEEELVLDGDSRARMVSPVADLTTFISSYPGYASLRNYMTGSWFIQTLCKQLLQQGHLAPLHDIFISVTDELNKKCFTASRIMTTPLYKSTNTKKLLLPYIPEMRSAAAKKLLEKALFEEVYNEYLIKKVCMPFYKRSRNL
ncbi:caspase-3-like [Anabrus simplex]|uniref:caspase-3-like n=1 Tax=Anabrus simplex TaxID=316456 RepID=UPI0035A270BC